MPSWDVGALSLAAACLGVVSFDVSGDAPAVVDFSRAVERHLDLGNSVVTEQLRVRIELDTVRDGADSQLPAASSVDDRPHGWHQGGAEWLASEQGDVGRVIACAGEVVEIGSGEAEVAWDRPGR